MEPYFFLFFDHPCPLKHPLPTAKERRGMKTPLVAICYENLPPLIP
jgi:hypothetical protein